MAGEVKYNYKHTLRADEILIPGKNPALFRVWWDKGRPSELRIDHEGNLTVDQLRAFVAWCDTQPLIPVRE